MSSRSPIPHPDHHQTTTATITISITQSHSPFPSHHPDRVHQLHLHSHLPYVAPSHLARPPPPRCHHQPFDSVCEAVPPPPRPLSPALFFFLVGRAAPEGVAHFILQYVEADGVASDTIGTASVAVVGDDGSTATIAMETTVDAVIDGTVSVSIEVRCCELCALAPVMHGCCYPSPATHPLAPPQRKSAHAWEGLDVPLRAWTHSARSRE